MKNTPAFAAISRLYGIFNTQQKRQFQWLLVLSFISSITDLLGLASIIPVVGIVLTDTFYQKFITLVPIFSGMTKEVLLITIIGFFLVIIILKNLFGLYINYLQVKFVKNLYVSSSLNVLSK